MAAGRGHRSAMRELGIIYYTYTGPNLTKSFGLAHYYLSEAVKGQTDPESMFALANYQKESYFSKRDPQGLEKAKEWYLRAADMGHAGAKTALEKL
jgi:TPR repeat protein